MAKFKDIIITDLGQHALNEAITGHTKITFTKAVLASNDLASKTVQDVKAITTLDNQKETSVALLSSQNGAIVLSVTYDNDGLTKDIIFNSVGWYAMTDSTEFLFAVSRYSQPQYLTAVPPDTDETQSITLQVSLAVGQGNVQVVQTQAGVAMKADLSRAIKDWDNSIQQLTDIKADKSQVASDLAKKADQSSVDASVKSINDVLATKANSSDVSNELASKANQSDLEKTNAEVAKKADSETVNGQLDTKADKTALADYAKASDLTSDVKSLNDLIATKADAETVNNAIGKIDFTPYAKSVDVNKQVSDLSNQEKADIASVNKALAGKQDAGYSYSKAELDKKLLAMSTTTDGKIDATQVQNMIAGKANTADVNNQIETVTNLANNNYNKRPVIDGSAGDDLFAFKTNQLRLYPGNGKNCKNLPPAINTQWFTVEYVFETPNGDGVAIYRSPAPEIWLVGNNAGFFNTWRKVSDANDITNLQDQVNNIKGQRTVDAVDFNTLTDSGVYYVQNNNTQNKNNPVVQWGTLVVSNGNGHRLSQLYYPDDNTPPWYRTKDEGNWLGWVQLASASQANNAQNTANQANSGLAGKADKSQVNVDGNLYFADHSDHNNGSDILGQTVTGGYLKAIVNYNEKPEANALSDATTFAGGDANAGAMISISGTDAHTAKVLGYGNPNGQPIWSEYIAWKSDINNLQGQINNKANASDLASKANASDLAGYAKTTDLAGYAKSTDVASKAQITDLQNQISELKESNFEVQTFKDEASGKAWEAQKAGHRLAIIQS